MRGNIYDTYHGRNRFATFLKVLIVLLLLLLAAGLAALFFLEPYLVYSADGVRLELPPFFQGQEDTPVTATQPPVVVSTAQPTATPERQEEFRGITLEGTALYDGTAQAQSQNLRVALDMTQEWEKLASASGSDATLITGVVVGRKDFVEQNPDLVDTFLSQYEQSVAYTQEDVEGAAKLIGEYDIVPEAVAQKALPACNITFIEGAEMQEKLSGYLSVLFEQNPQSVGGALPDDAFYYSR